MVDTIGACTPEAVEFLVRWMSRVDWSGYSDPLALATMTSDSERPRPSRQFAVAQAGFEGPSTEWASAPETPISPKWRSP